MKSLLKREAAYCPTSLTFGVVQHCQNTIFAAPAASASEIVPALAKSQTDRMIPDARLPVELTAGEDFWRSNAGDQPENRALALLLPSWQGEDSFWEESKAAVIPA